MTKWVWFGGAAAIAIATLVTAGGAWAATVTNSDGQDYTLDVFIGDAETKVSVAAGATVELCPEGCILMLGDDELELSYGDENVTITEGRLEISVDG